MGLRLELFSRAWRDVRLLAGTFLVFCGTALGLSGAGLALEYGRAQELHGILIGKEVVRADGEKERSTRFVARYRVAPPDGGALEAQENLPRAEWEARALGSRHPVLYLASERRILPTAGGERAGAAIMAAIGVVLLAGGALLARAPAQRLRAVLRIAARGAPANAEVLDVFQTSAAVNRVILWRLRYRYRDARGAEHEGESELLTPGEAQAFAAGSAGAILYDPELPARSVWLGREPGAAAAAWPGFGARLWPKVRAAGRWARNLALFLAALIAAAVLAELVPALKATEAWMTAQRDELLALAIGATVGGIFLLVGAVIAMLMQGGEPMDHTGVENHLRSMRDAQNLPHTSRISAYRLFGRGAGVSGHDEFRIADFRRAIASGAVLREPVWRRRACAALGATLMFFGIFGVMIVVTPLALKLLLAGVVLYAVLRTAWAFVRA